jgi:hypothetical protein
MSVSALCRYLVMREAGEVGLSIVKAEIILDPDVLKRVVERLGQDIEIAEVIAVLLAKYANYEVEITDEDRAAALYRRNPDMEIAGVPWKSPFADERGTKR